MKKGLIICLIVLTSIVLTGCNKKNTDYKLKITQTSWSGWSADYKPEEKITEHDITLNKKYEIGVEYHKLVFTVTKITKDSITIKTTEAFSDNEKGVDLRTDKTEFTVTKDKKLTLTTPTMDAGDIYYLELIK